MFGIGFTELLLISVIAILFLGPDKLPDTMVQIAKFIKSVKSTIDEAKSSLDEELKIADLKDEALNYKAQLDNATNELKSFKNLDFDDMNNITYDDELSTDEPQSKAKKQSSPEATSRQIETKTDAVTFEKKAKMKKKDETTHEKNNNKGDA